MFDDKRSRKIAIVAHCILNQNSRASSLAKRASVVTEIAEFLMMSQMGIIQMPCPELTYIGLPRQPQTKAQYDNVAFRKHCRKIAKEIVKQIREYAKCGIETKVIIGVDGSPSCSVVDSGILMDELFSMLKKEKIVIPFYGICYEGFSKDLAELGKLVRD